MLTGQQVEIFEGRTYYRAKGVDWARFLPCCLAALVVAALLAEGMAELFRAGHYYIFIIPLLAALCVAGMMTFAVGQGRCRSVPIAALAGFGAGMVLYIGYFYFGMLRDLGPEFATRPAVLAKYIRLRMDVEVTRDINESDRDEKPNLPKQGDVYLNWARFVFELGLVLVITIGAAVKRARKIYCESCGRWALREITQFDPAQSNDLLGAFRSHSVRSLAALSSKAPFATIPNISLALDLCPAFKAGQSYNCPAFVSIKNITALPKRAVSETFEQSKGKVLIRGLQLDRDELVALAPRFKTLENLVGRSAVNAITPAREPDEPATDPNRSYAEITPLGTEFAGKILSRRNILFGNALAFSIVLALFASLGLVLWGALTAFPDHPPTGGVSPATETFGIGLMIVGGIAFVAVLVTAIVDSTFFGNRYIRKILREEFARRSSSLVDLNDPEALYVEIVPKLNWGKMMLENASDIGLIRIDAGRHEIRFEGDKERWRIPVAAISYCAVEEFILRQGNHRTRKYYLVLRANHRNGFWEAPIRPRGRSGPLPRNQKKAARRLMEMIHEIGGAAPPPAAGRT